MLRSLRLVDRMVEIQEDDAGEADALAARTLTWVAVSGLVYRLIAAPVPVFGFAGEVGYAPPAGLIAGVMAAVLLVNLAVLLRVLARGSVAFLRSRAVFLLDCLTAGALNVWASSVIEPNTLSAAYRDVFWFYLTGTVILWAGLRGGGTAAALVVGSIPLQVLMLFVNAPERLDAPGFVEVARMMTRIGWLVLATAGVLILASVLRQSARVALAAGHRAGRQAEQVGILRSMHDTVLQTLEGIALQARQRPLTEDRAREIESAARLQAADLRILLQRRPGSASGAAPDPGPRTGDPVGALRDAVAQAMALGLQVELVTAELTTPPTPERGRALAEAVSEALTNVRKHAGVRRVVVRAVSLADGVEVTVRDHGSGFDVRRASYGFGISESIRARMDEVGGRADVWSAPGRGTRVRLWAPL